MSDKLREHILQVEIKKMLYEVINKLCSQMDWSKEACLLASEIARFNVSGFLFMENLKNKVYSTKVISRED